MIACQVSPAAVTAAKRQLYADLLHSSPGSAVERSKDLIGATMRQPDFKEGVAAFAEKRPPRFADPVAAGSPTPAPGR